MNDAISGATKQCSQCRLIKPLAEFHKDRVRKDGCQRSCKPCHAARTRSWQKSNPERVKETSRRGYARNRTKRIAEVIEYQNDHPEQLEAKAALRRAVRLGESTRPGKCSECGKGCKPDGHHWSYEPQHRLDVIWLCKSCHQTLHNAQKRKERK